MSLTNCAPCCSEPQSVAVPGTQGNSAVTMTTAAFTIPAIGSTVAISVGDTAWLKVGANLFISDGVVKGNFIITAINSSVNITARFLGLVGDTAATNSVGIGAIVMGGLGNFTSPYDLDLLTAFTDSSGGTKSDTIAASLAKQTLILGPIPMSLVVNSQIWEFAVPFAFTLNSFLWRCAIAVTTNAKAATFTARINGVAVTGGVCAVANLYATGATQAATAVTAANTGAAGQTLEVIASGVTAFSEGYGSIEMNVTNTDLTATLAALAFKANLLRTALRHQ